MKKLVLFDVDNTLSSGSKAHVEAFSHAVREVYRVEVSVNGVRYYGKTDWQIIMEVLEEKGIAEERIKSGLKECMRKMVGYYNKTADRHKIALMGGVKELLKELERHGILMGLVTGNLEEIAWAKMDRLGIRRYFKVGGFGSEDRNRTNLVKIAIRKAEKRFGHIPRENIFVIGDTPLDVKAGREAGVKTISVATGVYTKDELKDGGGADFVLENLKDTEGVLKIIL